MRARRLRLAATLRSAQTCGLGGHAQKLGLRPVKPRPTFFAMRGRAEGAGGRDIRAPPRRPKLLSG